jgi:hypothetical protein
LVDPFLQLLCSDILLPHLSQGSALYKNTCRNAFGLLKFK